jgi:hypothetical protein
VPTEKIMMPVKFVVLADDNPAIRLVIAPGVPGGHEVFSPITFSVTKKWRAPFGQKDNNCSGQYVRGGDKVK